VAVVVVREHHQAQAVQVLAVPVVPQQVTLQQQTRVAVVVVQEAQPHQAVVLAVRELCM
jgi:hypothetical protein